MRIERIDVTQLSNKFKPRSLDAVELEVIHLKRAKMNVSAFDNRESRFNVILEFRGSTLIVTRTDGNLHANWVVEALETDYSRRYGVEDMLYPITTLENGRIVHSTVGDPEKFFEYLHLLHTLSSVRIPRVESRRSKNLRKLFRSV